MRRLRAVLFTAGILSAGFGLPTSRAAAPPSPLTNVQVVPLPGVNGRMDPFAIERGGQGLFGGALGNHPLEVLALAGGKRIPSTPNLNEPQGVAYLPSLHRIVAATRAGGTVTWFDDATYKPV